MPAQTTGQDALREVSAYFGQNNKKPVNTDADSITLQSAPDNIKAVNRYFNSGTHELEVFIALMMPAVIILVVVIFYQKNTGKSLDLNDIADKDYDFIEMVRLQKGLEEFDRDFLLQLSLENSIQPIYQALIDKATFEKIEAHLIQRISEQGEKASANNRVKHLHKLKSKLF